VNINTTAGPITEQQLGRTLIHEHVLAGYPGWFMDTRLPPFQRAEALARVVDAFQRLHAYGIRTVVDPCPADLGRDVEFCAEVSQRSGITLICTTGVYTEAMGIPYSFRHLETEAIEEIYCREIEDGIGRTGIRAGLIKIATGEGAVSAYERRMLTAATRAARATGVPLISHTENCSCGHDQIDIVTAGGLPAHRLLVGHCDGRDDHPYQASLAARGAYVGFDRFGLEVFNSDASRMRNLKQMIDAGYRDQVMVSQDKVNCFLGNIPGVGTPQDVDRIVPNWTMTHLFERIFPELLRMGVAQADLDAILLENPRRYFAGDAPAATPADTAAS
jgi:phosphotriesterase-related protein